MNDIGSILSFLGLFVIIGGLAFATMIGIRRGKRQMDPKNFVQDVDQATIDKQTGPTQVFLPISNYFSRKYGLKITIRGTLMKLEDNRVGIPTYFDLSKLSKIEELSVGAGHIVGVSNLILTSSPGFKTMIQVALWQNEDQLFEIIYKAAIQNQVPLDRMVSKILQKYMK